MHPISRLGVGIVVMNRFGKVLVLRRIAEGINGGWQMPESEIDRGENPRDVVLRELREGICTDAIEILAESQTWRSHNITEANSRHPVNNNQRFSEENLAEFCCLF
jgi:ADP-ribose pyrophosphatase YjhB (NUDIX family)